MNNNFKDLGGGGEHRAAAIAMVQHTFLYAYRETEGVPRCTAFVGKMLEFVGRPLPHDAPAINAEDRARSNTALFLHDHCHEWCKQCHLGWRQ